MGCEFRWYNDDKRIMCYIITGDWNWTDFHRTVRVSLFSIFGIEHQVDTLVDLRGTSKTPGGAVAHIRTIGKKQHPKLSGRAVIIGLDAETEAKVLAGNTERVLSFREQTIYFADNEAEALQLLN